MKKKLIPHNNISYDEWIFNYKITVLRIISLIIGIFIAGFAIYRLTHESSVAGSLDLAFGLFLLGAFILLQKNSNYYFLISKIFFVFSFVTLIMLFYFLPEQIIATYWVPVTLVLVFFLFDYKGGLLFLCLYITFIIYLCFTQDAYSMIEYIAWIASLSALGLVMYYYEKVKEREKTSLVNYASLLYDEVQKQTKTLKKQNIELQEHQVLLKQLNARLKKRIQEELQEHLKQEKILLHQCRLASMGEMIDFIAHQWRQPLMNINAILMHMDRTIELQQDSTTYLTQKMDEVTTLTSYMSQTIEDFRSLFKIDKKKILFDVSKSIVQVLELYNSALKDISVHMNATENIMIYEHQNEFNQVIIILLGNAIEALNQHRNLSKAIYIELHVNAQELSIIVEDNAGGIKHDTISKVFEPYFTTKEDTKGTGLGLYIAKIIVERNMQGNLDVINASQGAKFTITLRRHHAKTT